MSLQDFLPSRYRTLRTLGEGSQGSVLLAIDRYRQNTLVAVKCIRATLTRTLSPGHSLADEFLTLKRVAHPHIARVRDFGALRAVRGVAASAGTYFTADFVKGGHLLEWAATQSHDVRGRAVLSIGAQTLSALQYLQNRDLQHGDIKPANLLVEPADVGVVKLIDFGVARLYSSPHSSPSAESSQLVGTPAYLPHRDCLSGPDAIDRDLFGLGVSLFHAASGRLPFALGDRDALNNWWSARQPANLVEFVPDAPPLLVTLIQRLTAVDDRRFRSAKEAFEFVRGSVRLPLVSRPDISRSVELCGRDKLSHELAESATVHRRGGPFPVLVGPRRSGKETVLDAVAARLQVGGARIVWFRGLQDRDAMEELRAVIEEATALTLPELDDDAGCAALVHQLRRTNVVVLIEDRGDEATALTFLRDLCRSGRVRGARVDAPAIVAATDDVDRFAATLEIDRRRISAHPLEPIPVAVVRDVLREYFTVDDVPDALAERVTKESAGQPLALQCALERLARAGVRSDSAGALQVPETLPRELVDPKELMTQSVSLPVNLQVVCALLTLSNEPLSVAEAARRYPNWSVECWERRLEKLRELGRVRCQEQTGTVVYKLVPAETSKDWRADDREGREATRLFADFLTTRAGAVHTWSLSTLASAAAYYSAVQDWKRAGRLGELALSRFLRTFQFGLAARCAGELDSVPLVQLDARRAYALRLRLAQAFEREGQTDSVLRTLPPPDPGAPLWYQNEARRLRALALEKHHEWDAAVAELSPLRQLTVAENGSLTDEAMVGIEATARSAPLLFQAKQKHAGREALQVGREFLRRFDVIPLADRPLNWARVLGLFALAETVHGDSAVAIAHQERALALARRSDQYRLLRAPLNELGILYVREQRWKESIAVFDEMRRRATAAGDCLGALRAAYNVAVTHYRRNEFDAAEREFRHARALADLPNHPFVVTVWIGLAGVLRERGRVVEALRLYRRALRFRDVARANDIALVQNNLAEMYLALGRLAKAREFVNAALATATDIEHRFLGLLGRMTRGMIHWALGQDGAAEADFSAARERTEPATDARSVGIRCYWEGRLASRQGAPSRAIALFRKAMLASRAERHLSQLHLARLALMNELLGLGRRRAVRRYFCENQESDQARGRFQHRVLALRSDRSWPDNLSALESSCGEATATANPWEVFTSLCECMEDGALDKRGYERVRALRDVVAFRIRRRLPADAEASFVQSWLEADKAMGIPAPEYAVPAPECPTTEAGRLRLTVPLRGETFEDYFLRFLQAHGAAHGWLLRVSAGRIELLHDANLAGDSKGLPEVVTGGSREIFSRLREPGGQIAAGLFRMFNLGGTDQEDMILCLESGARDRPSDADLAVSAGAPTLVLAWQLRIVEGTLRDERAAHKATRDELLRVNSEALKSSEDLDTAFMSRQFQQESQYLGGQFGRMRTPVAVSSVMRKLLERLAQVAEGELPVLFTGESGVGKDLLARWLHVMSPRKDKPFLSEVCNVSESLLEAELFGFTKGAFTGALNDRAGILQTVSGGTLYLDEIADLSPNLQAKLLRVLEEKSVRPIGGEVAIKVDFRVVASSRRPLGELKDGLVRSELLFRLTGEVLEIPPLRERKEDIVLLVNRILAEYAESAKVEPPYMEPEVVESFLRYSWPGNIRELENELQRLLLSKPRSLTAEQLRTSITEASAELSEGKDSVITLKEARSGVERDLILWALERHRGNASKAAAELDVTRRYMGSLLDKHGISLAEIKARFVSPT